MATPKLNPKVDAYIAKAQPFAQPILAHIRKLVHKGCPEIEETIKWSRPFFEYKGNILCNMAAFKEHCSMGFWGQEIAGVLRAAKRVSDGDGMGTFGKIARVEDLPGDKELVGWVKQAAAFVDEGTYTSPISARRTVVKAPKPELAMPAEFSAALKKNKKAAAVFEGFSPSCKREYLEWFAEAKRPETREKRIEQAVAWIAEGKQRNWKYQNC
ncbi:hypothetical protein DYQ86_14725 [Acidobacteria bacterium AB60]|nr:hypothetical protein DYQ86_14725 [Acidobacteria bacterium AB60]